MLWIAGNATRLGVDVHRLAVAGDSAGGNLSAVVCIDARERSGPRPIMQLLIYPCVDMAQNTESARRHAEQLPLTRNGIVWFMNHYLRGPTDVSDWRASPLRANNLANLPPAFIITAGFDPLSDEGETYARALGDAGVPVKLERFEGQLHGFLTMGRIISDSRRAIDLSAAALRAAFTKA
jgi:acetyl esterase